MPENPALLDLPTAALVPIAVGFLCYILAFTGRDSHHSTAHTVLITVVFAAIVRGIAEALGTTAFAGWGLIGGSLAALFVAALWRKGFSEWTQNMLRSVGLSDEDGQRTALQSVLAKDRGKLTEICVWTETGKAFLCEHVKSFESEPKGHCWIGPDGSVGLYVTSIFDPITRAWERDDPRSEDWGTRLTVVPANQVARLQLRYR